MNTKTITLKVEIEVPENYDINEPECILYDAVDWLNREVNITYREVNIISVTKL